MRGIFQTIISFAILLSSTLAYAVDIQTWQTTNGAKVFFVEAHEIPIVDARIMFDAGSARDGNAFGLAAFTGAMLMEGTRQWSVDDIAQRLEDTGSLMDIQTANDFTAISLRSLRDKKYLEPASEVFTEIIAHPRFPQPNFQRLQQNILQGLQKQQENPNAIAIKALLKAIYADHPYGHTQSGDEQTISQMKPKMLKDFHQQYYVANNATVVIVGDLTPAQAKQWANTLVAKLPQGKKPAPLPLATAQAMTNPSQHIDFNASQNAIRMGELGIASNDADFFPLMLGNYIFGGGMLNSRLFKQVRDVHGYTYGAYSSFIELKDKGPFIISMASRNEVAQQAIDLTQSLLKDFIEKGVTEQELQNTKQYMTRSFDLTLSSNSQILQQVASIAFFGLPLDYLDTYRHNVNAVTREQIQQAFKKHIDPNNIVTITVGPSENS